MPTCYQDYDCVYYNPVLSLSLFSQFPHTNTLTKSSFPSFILLVEDNLDRIKELIFYEYFFCYFLINSIRGKNIKIFFKENSQFIN